MLTVDSIFLLTFLTTICFLVKFDEDHLTSRSSQSTNNKLCPNKSNSSITTSKKRTPVRDESFIVASEVRDSNEMSEERLREAFEVINATADRILDQIDKVGSFNGDDDGDYYPYEQYNDKRTSTSKSTLRCIEAYFQCSCHHPVTDQETEFLTSSEQHFKRC